MPIIYEGKTKKIFVKNVSRISHFVFLRKVAIGD